MADRTYETGGRTFVITLQGTPLPKDAPVWTVEHVTERGAEISLRGLDKIASSSQDKAYTLACDEIDKCFGRCAPTPERASVPKGSTK